MDRYNQVLDVISITSTYPETAYALAAATQKTALAYLNRKANKKELLQLIQLANDLGYIDDDIYQSHATLLNKR